MHNASLDRLLHQFLSAQRTGPAQGEHLSSNPRGGRLSTTACRAIPIRQPLATSCQVSPRCLSVCLSACLSVCLSVGPSVCPSVHPSVRLSVAMVFVHSPAVLPLGSFLSFLLAGQHASLCRLLCLPFLCGEFHKTTSFPCALPVLFLSHGFPPTAKASLCRAGAFAVVRSCTLRHMTPFGLVCRLVQSS